MRVPPSDDAMVLGEIGGAHGRATRREILWRSTNQEVLHAERARDKVGCVIQTADTHGALLAAHDDHFPPHSAHYRIAALRQLEQENTSEAGAVAATHTELDQANSRYQGGAAVHLEVVVAENAYLAAQLSAVDIQV